MEIDRVRFERTSRAEVNVYIGDRLVARLKRGRGYPRGAAPYFFNRVSLSADFNKNEAAIAMRAFCATDLGTRLDAAAPKVASFLNTWQHDLLITSMFMDLPNIPLNEAIAKS